MTMRFHISQRFFFIFSLLALLTLGSCASNRPIPSEADDVYVNESDRRTDEFRKMEWESEEAVAARDSISRKRQDSKKGKREINPRLLRALVWTGGIILQFGIDFLLVYLLYS